MKLANRIRKSTYQRMAFRQQAGVISLEGIAKAKNLMLLDRPPPPW